MRTYHLHTTPHEFEGEQGRAKDWGHYLRTYNLPWRWWHRVLAWNPCNNIGNLYGNPGIPEHYVQRRGDVEGKPYVEVSREDFVSLRVLPKVYSDDKSDLEIIADGVEDMLQREEIAFAEYRRSRDKRHGR